MCMCACTCVSMRVYKAHIQIYKSLGLLLPWGSAAQYSWVQRVSHVQRVYICIHVYIYENIQVALQNILLHKGYLTYEEYIYIYIYLHICIICIYTHAHNSRRESQIQKVSQVQKYKSLRLLLLQVPAKSVHWTHLTWLQKKEGGGESQLYWHVKWNCLTSSRKPLHLVATNRKQKKISTMALCIKMKNKITCTQTVPTMALCIKMKNKITCTQTVPTWFVPKKKMNEKEKNSALQALHT